MQAHAIELIAGKRWTLRGALSAAPVLPLTQALHHKGIHLIELPVGVSRPEIVPPSREVRVSVVIILLSAPSRLTLDASYEKWRLAAVGVPTVMLPGGSGVLKTYVVARR